MSAAPAIAVVPTGVANIASVLAGLRRAGGAPALEQDPDRIATATHVMLPGVGAFGHGMGELQERGLDQALRTRVAQGRPLMSICLGLQLLCRGSEESPGVDGLACVDAEITHFPAGVRAPQFGWNKVVPQPGCRFLAEGYAYFANSYRLATVPEGVHAALGEHGGPFVAAFERGPLLACQFHPELSSAYGIELMRRWIQEAPSC